MSRQYIPWWWTLDRDGVEGNSDGLRILIHEPVLMRAPVKSTTSIGSRPFSIIVSLDGSCPGTDALSTVTKASLFLATSVLWYTVYRSVAVWLLNPLDIIAHCEDICQISVRNRIRMGVPTSPSAFNTMQFHPNMAVEIVSPSIYFLTTIPAADEPLPPLPGARIV